MAGGHVPLAPWAPPQEGKQNKELKMQGPWQGLLLTEAEGGPPTEKEEPGCDHLVN